MHTPYAPPYSPDIFSRHLQPRDLKRLYQLSIPAEIQPPSSEIAEIIPLQPERLKTELMLLFTATFPQNSFFPPPDEQEAGFLLRRIEHWSTIGWLAQVNNTPVGFVLMQPDLSPILKRHKGGRNMIRRGLLQLESKRSFSSGRLIFGGVLPEWRRKGIGTQLLTRALHSAKDLNWSSLSIGPIPENSDAAAFLTYHHAGPLQTYTLYEREL
jgi:GNAT superfamily N-acetyltransferase